MDTIQREEWDFCPHSDGKAVGYSGCPNDELIFCFEYEYARESGVSLFSMQEAISEPVYMRKFYELFLADAPSNLGTLKEKKYLPPWLSIDKEERNQKLAMVRKYDLNADVSPVSSVGVELLMKDGHYQDWVCSSWFDGDDLNLLTVNPFRIAWKYSNEEIEAAFSRWLTANRPKIIANKKGKNSATNLRATLKALGATRLCKKKGTDREAEAYSKKVLGFALYSGTKWSDAKKTVESIIAARSNPKLANTLFTKAKDFCSASVQLEFVSSYLQTEPRSVLLRLVALGSNLLLKRVITAAMSVAMLRRPK